MSICSCRPFFDRDLAVTPPPRGRSIRMFLADGTPTGLIIAEIVDWTGKAIVVPRPALAAFLKREEAQNAGVYILTGADPDDPFRQLLYIGQSETVGRRLVEHDSDPQKDFFERAIIFVSKDENLTNAHARFLERHLTHRISLAGIGSGCFAAYCHRKVKFGGAWCDRVLI
jgi:predicted GIY-YIG superfamily endonuclease